MRAIAVVISLILSLSCTNAETWALKGTLLTPETTIENGVLIIAEDKISYVGPQLRDQVQPVEIDGIVIPGFIDLHNHLTWNVFPRWRPGRKFANRYEWQDTADYNRALSGPHKQLLDNGFGCQANFADEIRAMLGGVTSIVGSFAQPCVGGLVRNLDFESGLKPSPSATSDCDALNAPDSPRVRDVVVNEVFPFVMNHKRVDYLRCKLTKGELRGLVVHLAEGNPFDAASKREFVALKALELLGPGLVIVHGTALSADELQQIKSAGAGMVWSPRSNDELYGATANMPAAKQAGAALAIAPDWSPSGSSGLLQEITYAKSRYPTYFSSAELISMATVNAAKLVRLDDRIGRLAAGRYGDFIVIRPVANRSPADTVAQSSPADVRLVVIGGQPLYGDADLMAQLLPAKRNQFEPITVCGRSKVLYLEGAALQTDWKSVQDRLGLELQRDGLSLNPFECN